MGTYVEQDAVKVIPMVSDDGGVTWYPKAGDPTVTVVEQDVSRTVRLESADSGVTWTPKEN